jgi:subtilisin family serine protease
LSVEAAAKNIICIGASEGYRPPTENWGGASKGRWGSWAPFNADYISDNIEGMAAFSSRGPAADGRIKPDLVAPGTDIISVWSRPAAQLGSSGWGEFSGPYREANPRTKYCYMGGTSMATPLSAGAAALVREYFAKGKPGWDASAALVKATLINGAHDMSPGQYGTGAYREMFNRPNGVEGWGRIDLARALFPNDPRTMFWIDKPLGLMTDQYHRLQYRVKNASEPLIVNIVWTDPPATPTAGRALVNDLNLRVTAPDGTVTYGNRPAGDPNPDQINNVEMVQINNPAPGTYELRIEGRNVALPVEDPRQTYALVVSGAGEPVGGRFPDIVPPQVGFITPTDGATLTGTVRIEVNAVDNQAIDRVTVKVDNNYQLGSRFGAPYVFYWNTAAWKPGIHTVTATATDFGRNTTTASISVTLR